MVQTGTGDMDSVARAANRGIVFQYVTFPWKREELKITIDAALEVYYLKVQNRNLDNHLNEVKQTLERKVMERTRKIEQQRINMTDSIRYASRIQKAMMLSSEELERIMPSHFILNKPKDIVSGDFFWVSNRNGRLIVALADCTGHGVPGAFMSILGINLLNEIVSGMETPRTADILNELRSRVVRAMGQTGKIDEAKEGMEMALCMLDPGRGMIQFSGANRPLYLASGGELNVIKGDRMPIGVYYEEELPFTSTDVPYKEHDILYLFTDGFVDQIGGLHRKTFRTTRFRKLIQEICHRPLDEQKAILREEHEIWRAGQEQIDDIMVMGIRL
jgi:serine phosphatase RsbU (regulator of sigma subunit)